MKKHIVLIFSFFLLIPALCAGSAKELFNKANNAYQEGEYQEAINMYDSVVNMGYESYELYFNMGNTHYKLENIPFSILYFEKAKKLMPGDEDVEFNLKLVNLQTIDKIEPVGNRFLNSLWEKVINLNSADHWGQISIILLFAGFALLGLYLFLSNFGLRKTAFFSGNIIIIAGLLAWLLAFSQNHRLNTQSEAIIFSANVTVKSAPEGKSSDLFVIHEGTKVILLQEVNDWYEVALLNGNSGWIKESNFKKI